MQTRMTLKQAQHLQYLADCPPLLTHSQYKIDKSNTSGQGYMTVILHLLPSDLSGVGNVCPAASKGCKLGCLNKSGRGAMSSTEHARLQRTKFFFSERNGFQEILLWELIAARNKAQRKGLTLAIRLNGTSDLPFESIYPRVFSGFSNCVFYDYTKLMPRMRKYMRGELPSNLHLTFSQSEENADHVTKVLANGHNVAVVFGHTTPLPKTYKGLPVVDGNVTDQRFLDPAGVVVGLQANGRSRHDTTGFVVWDA